MIQSKLPHVGSSIFSVMSAMAAEEKALNLSQGFPDFGCDPKLVERVNHYMKEGKNQYPPMPGIPELRNRIAALANSQHRSAVNPATEVTVTAGATQAIYTAITALVQPGDEVITFSPAYDCYAPAIALNGAKNIDIPLTSPDFKIDWQRLKDAVGKKTRMVIVNTPHNPSGSLMDREDWNKLADILKDSNAIVLSDEVYEHIIFDGQKHCSVLAIDALRNRSIVTGSFGKTFHVTGWKMGYCIAPESMMKEIRKVHQFIVFTVHSPSQYALAEYMKNEEKITGLGAFYQRKRDLFLEGLADTRFQYIPSNGTYFQLLNFEKVSEQSDRDFAEWMTREMKLAAIPISVFYSDQRDNHLLRFCFAKGDETLRAAGEILQKVSDR